MNKYLKCQHKGVKDVKQGKYKVAGKGGTFVFCFVSPFFHLLFTSGFQNSFFLRFSISYFC